MDNCALASTFSSVSTIPKDLPHRVQCSWHVWRSPRNNLFWLHGDTSCMTIHCKSSVVVSNIVITEEACFKRAEIRCMMRPKLILVDQATNVIIPGSTVLANGSMISSCDD